MKKSSAFLIAAAIVLPVAAHAATPATSKPKPLGVFNDWTAATYGSGPDMVCYAFALTAAEKDAKTAPAMLTIAERATYRDEISLSQGLTYAKDETVTVKVGTQAFKFFTKDTMAYALKGADVTKAFMGGASATATAKGKDGNVVTDTFSLTGFSDAYKAILKACPAPAGKGKS